LYLLTYWNAGRSAASSCYHFMRFFRFCDVSERGWCNWAQWLLCWPIMSFMQMYFARGNAAHVYSYAAAVRHNCTALHTHTFSQLHALFHTSRPNSGQRPSDRNPNPYSYPIFNLNPGTVLAQKFWMEGIAPSSPSSPVHHRSPKPKNTNFICSVCQKSDTLLVSVFYLCYMHYICNFCLLTYHLH